MSRCKICNVPYEEDESTHINTQPHRFNFLLFEWNQYRKALVKNRHGVELDIKIEQQNGFKYDFENGKKGDHSLKITPQDLQSHGNTVKFLCKVKNIRNKSSILLTNAVLLYPSSFCCIYDPNNNIGYEKYPQLAAGAEYTLVLKFTAEDGIVLNSYKIPVSFNFQTVDESNTFTFTIARSINISIEEHNAEDEPSTKSPFTGNDWPPKIVILNPTQAQRYADQFPIPERWMKCLKYGVKEFRGMTQHDYTILNEIRKKLEPDRVTPKNYADFWHIVLWIEEVGQMLGLQRYNMENVKIKLLSTSKLELEVPGLAEKRPSVIAGDMIDIKVNGDSSRGYRGIIKQVNDKSVIIGCVHEELTQYIGVNPDIELDVRFIMGRLPLERQHQGVCQVVSNGMVPSLFGDLNVLRNPASHTSRTIRKFINPLIANNMEQKTAVSNILNNTSSSAPYIVFGPPGTGKTITIVEAILQIKEQTKKNILVCAPANAACDMLTEKLMMHCSKKEMIRIMSETVDTSNVHETVLQYSNYDSNGVFEKVTPEQLKKYRIVITTLILIGRYSRRYYPDVVFVDEAAQACEPEVTSALGMLDSGKQIILAGDPKQLGPSLSSHVSKQYGLDKSLLERLMDLDLYKNEDHNFITMLKLNFRSHSTILKLPNELFYGGQLKAVSASSHNDPLANMFVYRSIPAQYKNKRNVQKRKVGHPVEFCSIIAKERREGSSPSYFNKQEMFMVLKYVQALVTLPFENEEDKVLPEQIGVVTPYVRQVHKVKAILKSNGFINVEVGTTETFQGREKRVIIITTVRAQKDLLLYDKKYNLGFVRHDKRFNVALTRAMSKLIIIGCPMVLGTDIKWLKYIELCEELSTYCGTAYPRRTADVVSDVTKKLDNVQLVDAQYKHNVL